MATNLAKLTSNIQKSQIDYKRLSDTVRQGIETMRTNPRLIDDDRAVTQMIGLIENVIKKLDNLDSNLNEIDKQFKNLVLKSVSDIKKLGRNINDPQNKMYYNKVVKGGWFGGYKLNNRNMVLPPLLRMPAVIDRLSRQATEAKEAVKRANNAAMVAKRQQENQARRNAETTKVAVKAQQNAETRQRLQNESATRNRQALEAQERKRQNIANKAVADRLQAQRQRQLNKESQQQKLATLAKLALEKGTTMGKRFNNANRNSAPVSGTG